MYDTLTKQTAPTISVQRADTEKIILESLPVSHYVEKVRWCLEKAGLKYEEEKDIGIFGAIFFGRMVPTLRVPGKRISIPNSSDILRYIYGVKMGTDPEGAKFLEPTPEALEWEAKIDQLGSDLRQFVYYHILVAADNSEDLAMRVWSNEEEDVPAWQKIILKIMRPLFKKFIIDALKTDKEGSVEGLKKSQIVFKEVDELLKNGQEYILGTDEPTYIDYSFASLAALLAVPDQYCGGSINPRTRSLFNELTPGFQAEKTKFRKTPAGKFVLKLYQEHR